MLLIPHFAIVEQEKVTLKVVFLAKNAVPFSLLGLLLFFVLKLVLAKLDLVSVTEQYHIGRNKNPADDGEFERLPLISR